MKLKESKGGTGVGEGKRERAVDQMAQLELRWQTSNGVGNG